MPRTHLVRSCPIEKTARVSQIEALFDLPIEARSSEEWDVDLPLHERDWSVGLIVGPSGSGKSTVARELFADFVRIGYEDWPTERCVLDAMPKGLSIKDITGMLTSVGFGSPPNWLRPYHVLSTGEQFRVTAARALLEDQDLVVLDEFTSVVDRQVAQIASHSIQKTVRRTKKRFIAVTCHYDVLDWLQPDWVYQPQTNSFLWRSLQRHPELDFRIYRVDASAWRLFSKYHYLSNKLHPAAVCFGGFIGEQCVAFSSYLHLPHPRTRNIKQGHRLVVRPDYQGMGLGGRFDDWLGQFLYNQGYRYHNTVAHPAMIAYYSRSPRWMQCGQNSSRASDKHSFGHQIDLPSEYRSAAGAVASGPRADPWLRRKQAQFRRLNTVTFEYVPPRRDAA